MRNIKLKYHEVLNDLLLFKWDDNTEDILKLKLMRNNCPCANCAGEKDVFGNIYKGPEQKLKEDKDNKEENENTYANASGISLAVRPLSRKYSLILPILSFRSRKRAVR